MDETAASVNPHADGISTFTIGSDAIARANDMMNYVWYPTQIFIPNEETMSYPANKKLTGIPYSQGIQTNLAEFETALNYGDFYKAYFRGNGDRDPMYGLDCSGFLCAAWNVPRTSTGGFFDELKKNSSTKYVKIGSYNLTNKVNTNDVAQDQLISSYAALVPSAGLVKRINNAGHARFVVSIDGNYVNCIDTSFNFPSLERYSFTQLADDGYLPFWTTTSYKETGWVSQ